MKPLGTVRVSGCNTRVAFRVLVMVKVFETAVPTRVAPKSAVVEPSLTVALPSITRTAGVPAVTVPVTEKTKVLLAGSLL